MFGQVGYDVRLEWGPVGAADVNASAVVPVLVDGAFVAG